MKEQEVLCFVAVCWSRDLNDDINEHIALLNAVGKRVINISFAKYDDNHITVCLLCEKE